MPARTRGPRAAKVARGRTTGGAGSSGLPCAMVLRLIRALPGDRALLPPSSVDHSTTLAPASGRQDHTTSPSAPAPLVLRRQNVHRIPPRVRDDRDTPLLSRRDGANIRLIWVSEKAKYFFRGGWTGESKNRPSGKSVALAARVAKPSPEDIPPSLRGALLSAEARLRARADATKQSIARRTRLWIASLTGRRLAPSRWLAMTIDDTDIIRTSESPN